MERTTVPSERLNLNWRVLTFFVADGRKAVNGCLARPHEAVDATEEVSLFHRALGSRRPPGGDRHSLVQTQVCRDRWVLSLRQDNTFRFCNFNIQQTNTRSFTQSYTVNYVSQFHCSGIIGFTIPKGGFIRKVLRFRSWFYKNDLAELVSAMMDYYFEDQLAWWIMSRYLQCLILITVLKREQWNMYRQVFSGNGFWLDWS